MKIKVIRDIAIVESKEIMIKDISSALDFMINIGYQQNCKKVVINKEAIIEEFFILSTKLAGEVLQKFINYGMKLAIVGDFSKYTSKPLKNFMYESNEGKDIFFVENEKEAILKLEE